MGNRAIITNLDRDMGIYLHWNGGRDSVEAFLEYCRLKGFRDPVYDESYAFARLTQIIANYFGGTTSVGMIGNCKDQICMDNGNYIIGKDWKIIDRDYPYKDFEEQNQYDINEMLKNIDISQPKKEQLGKFLDSKEIDIKNLKKGDIVYFKTYKDNYEKYKVIGYGKDEVINGKNVFNIPYVNMYEQDGDYSKNINNYILSKTVRLYENDRQKDNQVELD